jgi:hypothetical protein
MIKTITSSRKTAATDMSSPSPHPVEGRTFYLTLDMKI